jgi:hypothetical protein
MVFFAEYSLIVIIHFDRFRSIGAIFDGRNFENLNVKMCLVTLNPDD